MNPEPLKDKSFEMFDVEGRDYKRVFKFDSVAAAVEWLRKELVNHRFTDEDDAESYAYNECLRDIRKLIDEAFEDVVEKKEGGK